MSESRLPNVIYILADDLGYGDLGSYGQQQIHTPQLDRMAQEGMRFTNHYSGNTVCAPSRASLMTGLHQGHAPIRGNRNNVLGNDQVTLAQLFQDAGYATALIGKWGLGEVGTTGEPNQQGFDTYFGYLNQTRAHNYYPDYLISDGRQIPLDNKVVYASEGYAKGKGSAATEKNQYSHSIFIDSALSFVERNAERPFFLYLPLTIPHANNEGKLAGDHGMEVPDLGAYAERDWPEPEKGKAAMISLLDGDVGRLLEALEGLGIDDQTLVIFTSDNGPHKEGGVDAEFLDSNGDLRGTKRDLYEGGIRVPLIARWPGKIKAGSISDLPSAFWDVLPTVADLTGQPLPREVDGISFLPTLLGQNTKQATHDYLYWEFAEGDHDAQAVRQGAWKLLHLLHEDTWELYNLEEDPGEQRNLAPDHPEIVERLTTYINAAHRYDSDYPLLGEDE